MVNLGEFDKAAGHRIVKCSQLPPLPPQGCYNNGGCFIYHRCNDCYCFGYYYDLGYYHHCYTTGGQQA